MTREGELEFDFSLAIHCDKLDEKGRTLPHGMSFVDFVIEENECLLLVEVKDPSSSPKGTDSNASLAVEKQRKEYLKKLRDDSLINQELTPKARNSYLYLHLMGRDEKPMRFVFLLGTSNLLLDPGLLLNLKDRLLNRIRKEVDTPWAKQYVTDCMVLTEATWERAFPQYALKRVI